MHKHLHIIIGLQLILLGRRKTDNEEDPGSSKHTFKMRKEYYNLTLSLYTTSLEGFVAHTFWLSINLTKELEQTYARNEKGPATSDRPGYRSQ